MKNSLAAIILLIASLFLAACATISHRGDGPLPAREAWGVAPLINSTETPYASERATAIALSLLRARGVGCKEIQPAEQEGEKTLSAKRTTTREFMERARQMNLRYLLTGTVTEWRYKVGLDGEPVAGVTLEVVDLKTGSVVWTASGGKSGWSREALSAVGQQVISSLLATLPLVP